MFTNINKLTIIIQPDKTKQQSKESGM